MYTLVKMRSDDRARVETTEITRGNENVLHICTYTYTYKYMLLYIHINKTVQTIGSRLWKLLEEMKMCYVYVHTYTLISIYYYIHTPIKLFRQ